MYKTDVITLQCVTVLGSHSVTEKTGKSDKYQCDRTQYETGMHGGTGRAIRNSKNLVLISFISSLSNTRPIIEVIDLSRIDNKVN